MNNIPKAVNDKINSLTGGFGSDQVLLQSISEVAGKITGTTIPIVGTVTNDATAIPTSRAVYNKVNEDLTTH